MDLFFNDAVSLRLTASSPGPRPREGLLLTQKVPCRYRSISLSDSFAVFAFSVQTQSGVCVSRKECVLKRTNGLTVHQTGGQLAAKTK